VLWRDGVDVVVDGVGFRAAVGSGRGRPTIHIPATRVPCLIIDKDEDRLTASKFSKFPKQQREDVISSKEQIRRFREDGSGL